MNLWPFWMFEENIKIVNELIDKEEESRKKIEQEIIGRQEIVLKK